ncbi:MAG: PEP-CTERM sorting domain-containing protein [Gemmatimonadaceae bacterium]|nr:PEP-CTERM sorting domain-containing protein [Gemmatimonadaceae bacterium]
MSRVPRIVHRVCALVARIALAAWSEPSEAQGWVTLPGGNFGYMTDYTTSGMFSCGNRRYILGSCFASGNTVKVISGMSGALITFVPASNSIVASGKTQKVSLGTLSISYFGTGAPRFPIARPQVAPLFRMSLGISTSAPLAASGGFWYTYTSRAGALRPALYNSYTVLPVTPPPSPARYNGLIFASPTRPLIPAGAESIEITAQVSVTPEPATLILFASGLASVGAIVRRRRRDVGSQRR